MARVTVLFVRRWVKNFSFVNVHPYRFGECYRIIFETLRGAPKNQKKNSKPTQKLKNSLKINQKTKNSLNSTKRKFEKVNRNQQKSLEINQKVGKKISGNQPKP